MSNINEIGKTYARPWGSYKTIELGEGFQVKTITVLPEGRLSLQSHFKRSEHWVVVNGEVQVTVDERVKVFVRNEAIYIPLNAKHRLENFSTKPATIVEVQVGDYLGEDDIVRYDDIYGRDQA